MVKPLSFKGDPKPKKRKRVARDEDGEPIDASKPDAPADDSWVNADRVTDISGPILIILPTDQPSALACDATGKVFTLAIENMIENDPATSEPHDVRQVWIANKVAGSNKFSFKSHHGKYLACDRFGLLSAQREAVSPEESFEIVAVADSMGSFAIQTEREKFFTLEDDARKAEHQVRGDAEDIGFNNSFRIRMQARFKPQHKLAKEEKAKEKISRKELEKMAGRTLGEEDVKRLKRARREGNFHETMLDVKVKGKHDKYA